MDFRLTEGQDNALQMVDWFIKNAAPPARAVLTGYSGTGKTTILRVLASQHGPPVVLAPTGKAALRVTEATGLHAVTAHRWLYKAVERDDGEMAFVRRDVFELEIPENKLIVVDESSMLTSDVWEDLWDACLVANVKILLVGDPYQLPPVEKEDGDQNFNALGIQTYFRAHLDEVMRQALGSPVLRAATMIRSGQPYSNALEPLNWILSSDVERKSCEVYAQGGMVICHKNDTRHMLNSVIREASGLSGDVVSGEPLMVTKNNYDLELFNGETVKLEEWVEKPDSTVYVYDRFAGTKANLHIGIAKLANGTTATVCAEQISGHKLDVSARSIEKAAKRAMGKTPFLHANLGYAMTCHKAQGSQAPVGVVFIEGSVRPNTYMGRRWVYTAVSRFVDDVYYSMV